MTPRTRTVCGACASAVITASAATRKRAARVAAVLMVRPFRFPDHASHGWIAAAAAHRCARRLQRAVGIFFAATMKIFAPGLTSPAVPGANMTTLIFYGTTNVLSPSFISAPAFCRRTRRLRCRPWHWSWCCRASDSTAGGLRRCHAPLPGRCGTGRRASGAVRLRHGGDADEQALFDVGNRFLAVTVRITGLSASLILRSAPSRDFTVSVEPSTLCTVPRTRTMSAGACASAGPASPVFLSPSLYLTVTVGRRAGDRALVMVWRGPGLARRHRASLGEDGSPPPSGCRRLRHGGHGDVGVLDVGQRRLHHLVHRRCRELIFIGAVARFAVSIGR